MGAIGIFYLYWQKKKKDTSDQEITSGIRSQGSGCLSELNLWEQIPGRQMFESASLKQEP